MKEWVSSADRSHPPRALCRNRENGKYVDNLMNNNGLTISTKNVSQSLTYKKEKYTIKKKYFEKENILFLTHYSI